MSDESKAPWELVTTDGSFNSVDETEDVVQTTETEADDSESKAREKGWVPKDEWKGNPNDWRSAHEFLDRSSFFEKISNQGREIRELRADVLAAKEHMQKLRAANEKALIEAREQAKLQALEEQDYHKVVEIDREIRQLEKQQEIPQPQRQPDESADRLHQEWLDNNPWYNTDGDMKADADAFGMTYRQRNPNASAEEVYNHVTSKVKKLHADKFSPQEGAQSRPSGMTTAQTRTANRGHGYTPKDLSEDERRVGVKFVKMGLYDSLQAYVDDVVKMNGIKGES